MIEKFETVREQLAELAPIINSFKSEAVQLRLIELIMASGGNKAITPRASSSTETSEVGETPTNASSARTSRRRRKPKLQAEGNSPKTRSPSGKVGAGTTLNELIAAGYFAQARLLGDIVKHSADTLARQHKASDFSPMLVRAVRDKRLERRKNEQGQYEYKQP